MLHEIPNIILIVNTFKVIHDWQVMGLTDDVQMIGCDSVNLKVNSDDFHII